MYNTYFSSTIYAFRCKESCTLSSNGYSNLWYERFERTPSCCSSRCGFCDFCSLSTYRVPVKSSLLSGLRQSTLIQLPASRRMILGGGDLYFSRLPSFELHRNCYEINCSVNERTVCNTSRRIIKGRHLAAVSRKGREVCHSFDSDDVESILSLLSEEADKDVCDIKLKNVSSSKRVEAEKKGKNVSKQRKLSLVKKVETEKKGILKQHEVATTDLRREEEKPNKEKEAFTKSENHRKQRDVSSCSSFYSLSSGGFVSDLEVQDKHDLEELSVGYEKDAVKHVEVKGTGELNRKRDDSKKLHGVSNQERTAFGADINWNLRKKSEKKLTDVTMQETESTKEHQDKHSKAFRTHEPSHGKASISHKQVRSEEDDSSFVKDLDRRMEKAFIKAGKIRRHRSTDTQESGHEVELTLSAQKTQSGREGNLEISETLLQERSDEHKKFVGSNSTTESETLKSKKAFSGREESLGIPETLLRETHDEHRKFGGSTPTTGKDVINRNPKKFMGESKVEDTVRTLNTRMKNPGEKKKSVLSYVQGIEEQKHQKGEKTITQAKERRKFQQFSEVSQVHESKVEDTSTVKSRTRINDWEYNSNLSTDTRGTWRQTDKMTNQSIQHRKGSEHVIPLSEGYASDEKQVSTSQGNFGKVRYIPKSKPMAVDKTRESSHQTDERIANFYLHNEDERPKNLSISDETASRKEATFHGSLDLVSEAGKHVIFAEGGEQSSPLMSFRSSFGLMGRDTKHIELTAGIASPRIIVESSDSGSSTLYDNSERSSVLLSGSYSTDGTDQAYSKPSNIISLEGATSSADRLQKSSKQFVGEHVERIRHEETTSETEEMEVTGTKLAIEDEGNQIDHSRRQGPQNGSQSKEHGSSHSAGVHGTKGPSDEIWDANEPSIENNLVAGEPKISKDTEKTIVRRTARSPWSMFGDLVRLGWGSPAGSSTSAGRSSERKLSNKSGSETWFSGQEHEETSKSNVIKETSVLPQITTSDRSKPSTPYTQSEGEVSDTKKMKDKGKHLEAGSSSPSTLESGSTLVGASYASGEANANWSDDGKDLKVTTSGIKNVELPILLPARGPPVVGEIVNIGGSDMSGTESIVPIKEPVAPVQSVSSGSGKKNGELMQQKFQQSNQVLRDRFDDWEEAYQLEFEQRRMDEIFMKEALLEAKKAADTWEVPVGAVLVQDGKIVARGCNLVEELRDATAHAEMICIREASNLLRTWRLSDSTLYVTLEPCPMCAGAILQSRIDTVVWGAPNKLLGADGSWIRLFPDGGESSSEPRDIPPVPVHPFHPKIKIRRGVLAAECADIMQQFFQLRRRKKKEESSNDPSSLAVTHHPSKFVDKIHDIFHVMFCL
ncbi:putative tRNA(adenine(34)) deaminase [Lupinus albus]|uniref:tRNA(adenine(34)) deaminase n=1 Tax=Lupinus albus TaxID=3870 RepID=A0A6A4NTX7_LUPAL|nr:putative tRNA(adenine(34)) deaminase [Lupinus albus]